jgi:2-polyprenyl-6-methoxyphenol hydroxylase-like FAD-dependent oxidoreductase
MNGVVLKACGHHVQILEAREPRLLEEEAAGLSVGPDAQDLMKTIGLEISDYAITAPTLQIMDARGEVVREMAPAFSLVTSSWSTMFTKLKAEFLSPKAGLGNTHFRERARVTDVTYDGHKVEVVYEDTINRSKHTIAADLVIAADGSRSTIRSLVMPDVESEYAGYVAWRGDIPEATVPSTLKGLFEGKMAMSMAENSYILL